MCRKMNIGLLKSREVKNAGWIIFEQVFQMLISLIVSILSARYLGPGNFGSLNYTASFVTFALSVATLGMEGVVIKKLVAAPGAEGQYLGSCMLYRIVASILSMIAVTAVVFILNPGDGEKVVLVLLQSFQLLFRAVQILDCWFQRHLKSRYTSIGKLAACLCVSAYKIFLLVTHRSIIWFAFSNALSDLVIALVLVVFYLKENTQKLEVRPGLGREVLAESYHFILSGLMTAIYSQMDKIMLGQILTDTDVGYYTTATSICGMWIFVPVALINSFRPKILELKQRGDEKQYLLRLKQLYSVVIWLSIGVSLVITFLGKWIVLVLYGEAYLGAVSALRIAIWFETFAMIGTARGIWILCEGRNRYVKYYLGIGALVNLVLNTLWIPVWGIEGAAFATLITQIVTSLIAPLLFRETRVHTRIVLDAFLLAWRKEK